MTLIRLIHYSGFEHGLIKFDGVSNNRGWELTDPMGYGKIEYAYHLMGVEVGIKMAPCRLHHNRRNAI